MPLRPVLGDFNSIICFRALVVGTEEALGERAAHVALKAAGRKRGAAVVAEAGKTGAAPEDPADVQRLLDGAVGLSGTRLCRIEKVERDDRTFRVHLSETVCSAGEPMGSPRVLTFTLGAVHGAMEALYGWQMRATQVGSVLRGQTHDIVEVTPR